jgi:hypothetical protein
VYIEGPWKGKCWYNLRTFGKIYDRLVVVIWYFSVLVRQTKKNLATLFTALTLLRENKNVVHTYIEMLTKYVI